MRIGYLHVDYGEWTDGSYNTQEIGLAKSFEKLGHESIIIYWVKRSSKKCFTEVLITDKIKKVYLPCYHIKHNVVFNPNHLKKYNLDLIHIQSDNLLYVPEVVRFCKNNSIPYYCYIGTLKSSSPNRISRLVIDTMSRRNYSVFRKSKVFAKTPEVKRELEKLNINNVEVAPVGLDLTIIPAISKSREEILEDFGIHKDKKIVMCVCALRVDKQPLDFFKLVDLLNEEYFFVFVGTGILSPEFESEIEKRNMYDRLKHIHKIPNIDIHQLYSISDYVVNFNENEIFGMSILEAMYHGCTVVARFAPGPNSTIINEVSGFLVNSIKEMAEVINSDRQIGGIAKEHVIKNFTWDTMAEMVLDYYGEGREKIIKIKGRYKGESSSSNDLL